MFTNYNSNKNSKKNFSEDKSENIPLENLNLSNSKINLAALDEYPIDEAAKLAVSLVGPRVYRLKGIKGDKLRFFLIGCSGSGNKQQYNVARCMDYVAGLSPEIQRAFIISAGDLIYPGAPPNPTHSSLKTNLINIYYNPALKNLSKLPLLAAVGNHENLYYKGAKLGRNYGRKDGMEAALNVVAATYVPDNVKYKKVSELAALFSQDELDLDKLPRGLVLPFFYWALQAGDIQLTFADSNNLPKAFAQYKKIQRQRGRVKTYDRETYQVPWLQKTYENFKDMFHIHVMHNPRYPIGKRAVKPDTGLFLKPDQQAALNREFNSHTEYFHDFINLILQTLGIYTKLNCTAHEHLQDYINTAPIKIDEEEKNYVTPPIRQIGSGGGGGDLQSREIFSQDNLGIALSNPGFWEVAIDLKNPKDVELTLYTIDRDLGEEDEPIPNHVLKFNLQSTEPIRPESDKETKDVKILRSILLNACDELFAQKEQQRLQNQPVDSNLSTTPSQKEEGFLNYWGRKISSLATEAINYLLPKYKPTDVDYLHDLIADLNSPYVLDLDKVLYFYENALISLTRVDEFLQEVNVQLIKHKEQNPSNDENFYKKLVKQLKLDTEELVESSSDEYEMQVRI